MVRPILRASLVLALIATGVVSGASRADAIWFPYGGRALAIIPCTCTVFPPPPCFLVTVGLPKPGMYMYCMSILVPPTLTTGIRLNENITPPAWQLGLSYGWAACMEYTGDKCVPVGGGPIVTLVGTSLF